MRWHVSGGGGKENIHLPIMLLERFIGGGVAAYIAGLEMHIHIYIHYTLGWSDLVLFFEFWRQRKADDQVFTIYIGAQFQKINNFGHGKVFIFNKSHWPKKLIWSFGILHKTFLILQRTIEKNHIWNLKLLNIFLLSKNGQNRFQS